MNHSETFPIRPSFLGSILGCPNPDRPNLGRSPLGAGLLLLGVLSACGGGGAQSADKTASTPPGTPTQKPDGSWFFADPNAAGNEQEPRILRQAYGRLVEVFGLDAFGARVHMFSDFVIDANLVSDGQNYLREINPVTAQHVLVVLRDVTDTSKGGGRDQFFDLTFKAEQNMSPIHENDANGAGLYSMVPRNAAIVIQFDDLLDPETLDPTTLRVNVGSPPILPFEGRVFVDPNHGDLAEHDGQPGKEYYGTRVIIDTTVSELESFQQDPPLPVNGVGLPAAKDVNLANLELRIPTEINISVGQKDLLRNPSGHPVTAKNNGPTDSTYGTLDVVRAARSGGPEEVTGDSFNGFMLDMTPPILVGNTPIELLESPEQQPSDPELFRLPRVRFESTFCSQTPQAGDVIRQPGLFAEIVNQPPPVDQNGEVQDILVRLLLHPYGSAAEWENAGAGPGQFLAAYDPVEDAGKEACFVRVFPDSTGFPENPVEGLRTDSTYALRFSEPMDPSSLTAFDSVTLTRKPIPEEGALNTSDYVIGSLSQSVDLQEFTFLTDLPLAHQEGLSEDYYLTLTEGDRGPIDLAGNPLTETFPSVHMTVDPTEVTQHNNGRVTRFTGLDEEPPFGDDSTGPLPEWGGQLLYDLQRELIRPRPVIHFNAVADRSQPVPKLMTPFTSGVQTPLSGLGSKMQTLWRYCDFGWSLTDTSNHNIDVEGLYWSPAIGSVIAETFSEFSIRVGHCKYLPDEYIDPGSLFPKFFKSGLLKKFDGNWYKKSENKLVHSREKGYTISPGDLFVHPVSGTKLMPFPWNRNVAPEDWKTWTWRNTDLRKRWGKDGSGAPLMQEFVANGQPFPSNIDKATYVAEHVLADALPMMMEFSCYPDPGAIGLNAFDISLAANSSSKPYFRAFSTGGIDSSGNTVIVNPDSEEEANGGFSPAAGGAKTYGLDNSYYIGAADFVTRIARVHSIWFKAIDPFVTSEETLFTAPIYLEPTKEPRDEDQPVGTAVVLNFRGASKIRDDRYKCCSNPQVQNTEPLENALLFDSFGDYYDHGCVQPDEIPLHNELFENRSCDIDNNQKSKFIVFFNDEEKWTDDISLISGAPYYQVRVTFESDIFTGLTPELSALAVAWFD